MSVFHSGADLRILNLIMREEARPGGVEGRKTAPTLFNNATEIERKIGKALGRASGPGTAVVHLWTEMEALDDFSQRWK